MKARALWSFLLELLGPHPAIERQVEGTAMKTLRSLLSKLPISKLQLSKSPLSNQSLDRPARRRQSMLPLRRLSAALLSVLLAISTVSANGALPGGALPTGGEIVAGEGAITQSGHALTVNQVSDRIVADWESFNIGRDASVTFVQPSADAVALNRVRGTNPSEILGSLSSNGQVFLINPYGVVFGEHAQVDVGALVASTLNVSEPEFMAGNYRFTGTGEAIVNQGSLHGGVVALIAPVVRNEGSIVGDAALAAGTDVTLDFDGDGLIGVTVDASTLATLVENQGLIKADGGLAVLTAKGAGEVMAGIVNNTGTIEAQRLAERDGRILLLGDMEHGEVNAGGTLRAAFVETSAADIHVDESLVVDTMGGEWLIDPVDITVDEALAGSIETALANGNVTISTSGGSTVDTTGGESGDSGDIFVNAPINWSQNLLTLRADRSIFINAPLTSTGTGAGNGLALEYAQTVPGGDYVLRAPVNLAKGSHYSTKEGESDPVVYTVITELGMEGSSGDGTLQGMRGDLSGNYVLGADIDASATAGWHGGAGFMPIGGNNTSNNFTGKFDGGGHTISNLTIRRPSDVYIGLFGTTGEGAVVKNVNLNGGSVTGWERVGALIGRSIRSDIKYASSSVDVAARNSLGYVGGLVGENIRSIITHSYATGAVSGETYVGGLVGENSGDIEDAYAAGEVEGNTSYVGGLAGRNQGTINRAFAVGAVTGGNNVSGLTQNYSGGVVNNSFYDKDTTGQSAGEGTAKSTADMKKWSTFTGAGWDFATVWGMKPDLNNGYPVLQALRRHVVGYPGHGPP